MMISCAGILVRSAFRIAEFSQGYRGYLATHEAYFYLLDALPLLFSTAVFTVCVWPERCLRGQSRLRSFEMEPTAGQKGSEA